MPYVRRVRSSTHSLYLITHPTLLGGVGGGRGGVGGGSSHFSICACSTAYAGHIQQQINSISTAYPRRIHRLATAYPHHIHRMSTAYPLHILSRSTAYPQHIKSISSVHPHLCYTSLHLRFFFSLCIYIYTYICPAGKVLNSFALPDNPPHPTGRGGWWAGWGGGGVRLHSISTAYLGGGVGGFK